MNEMIFVYELWRFYCAALAAANELAAGYRPPHTHVVLLRWDLKLFEVKANLESSYRKPGPRAAECVGEAVYVERALAAVERASKP